MYNKYLKVYRLNTTYLSLHLRTHNRELGNLFLCRASRRPTGYLIGNPLFRHGTQGNNRQNSFPRTGTPRLRSLQTPRREDNCRDNQDQVDFFLMLEIFGSWWHTHCEKVMQGHKHSMLFNGEDEKARIRLNPIGNYRFFDWYLETYLVSYF